MALGDVRQLVSSGDGDDDELRFEEVAPCALRDAPLGAYLRGRWRLTYSSSLVSSSLSDLSGATEPGAWKRLATTLVAAPAARSPSVALGDP